MSNKIASLLMAMSCVYAGIAWSQTFRSIPNDVQIANFNELLRRVSPAQRLRLMPPYGNDEIMLTKWPGSKELERHIPPAADVPASRRAECAAWLRRVVKKEWVPPNIEARLVPLREFIRKDDYFGARYAVRNAKIQILIGPKLYMLISDADLRVAKDSKPQSSDLGARNYLNVPQRLAVSPGFQSPWQSGPGVWSGIFGGRRRGHTLVNTWYELGGFVSWDSNLWISASRWRSLDTVRRSGIVILNSSMDSDMNDPDLVQFGKTKHYVMFPRHSGPFPPCWVVFVVLTSVILVLCGVFYTRFRRGVRLRELN